MTNGETWSDWTTESESGLYFRFSRFWLNYDSNKEMSLHEKTKACERKGVDFFVQDEKDYTIYLIEVKHADFFNVSSDKLFEKTCDIFRCIVDTLATISWCTDDRLKDFQKNANFYTVKPLIVVNCYMEPENIITHHERLQRQIHRKFKYFNIDGSFLIQSLDSCSGPIYEATPNPGNA